MIEQNKELAPLTTFHIPAKARYYTEYSSPDELRKIMRSEVFRENKVLHIGGGSNLLFLDDFDGLVIKSNIFGRTIYVKDNNTTFAIAGAGENWDEFVAWTIEQGLAGLENLSGIPGQVGASAVQNIGAYGVEVGSLIHAVEVMDITTGEVKRLLASECGFGYRESIFKHAAKGRLVVLRVSYKLHRSTVGETLHYGPLACLAEKLGHAPSTSEVRSEIINIRNAKLPDPAEVGSAGSFFKNPVIDSYYFEQVVHPIDSEMPVFPAGEHHVKLSAAWLIDHAGLKGAHFGGAEVWPKQCLVIANTGNATGQSVAHLAKHIQAVVKQKYAVDLEPEVNYIDSSTKITVLGTGTSKGVPEIGCRCRTCTSSDARDKRLRASVFISSGGVNILIDPSPDFRQQALAHNIEHIDAVLITHSHYDHVGGLDDLRPFCVNKNVPVYAQKDVINDLKRRLDYCFREHPYPGVPVFSIHEISSEQDIYIDGVKITPIKIMHGKLPILGFRIGDFAYITDASELPDGEYRKLENLDTLIINALRQTPHFAHFSLSQALEVAREIGARNTWLTHICHEMGRHADQEPQLPANVNFAYDGLTITIK